MIAAHSDSKITLAHYVKARTDRTKARGLKISGAQKFEKNEHLEESEGESDDEEELVEEEELGL